MLGKNHEPYNGPKLMRPYWLNWTSSVTLVALTACSTDVKIAEAATPHEIEVAINSIKYNKEEFYILKKNNIVISEKTLFCEIKNNNNNIIINIGLDGSLLSEQLESMGQKSYYNGISRQTIYNEKKCADRDALYFGQVAVDKDNNQYTLLLAIWQRKSQGTISYWIGSVRRSFKDLKTKKFVDMQSGNERAKRAKHENSFVPNVNSGIEKDSRELTAYFLQSVKGAD